MNTSHQLSTITTYQTAPNTAVIVFHLFAEKKPATLDRSARLDLTNVATHRGFFQIAPTHEDAVFTNVPIGKYEISVTAVGYLTTHQELSAVNSTAQNIDILLQRDPSAVVLTEASGVMPKKAKKEANRAVSLLKSGDLASAQKHLETAYKLAPSNADLNFLIGYLHFQQNDYVQAATNLGTAANLNPHSAQTLTLLGRTNLLREDYPAARSALERAVLVDADDWLTHDLLADTYFQLKEYDKARDEAQIAILKGDKQGKNIGSPAKIILGQTLLALGRKDEGLQTLEGFLKDSPQNPMVYQVRKLITELQKSGPTPAAVNVSSVATPNRQSTLNSVGALPEPSLSMQTWRPPDVDDSRPSLVPGVVCPATQVLGEAGKRVQELLEDLSRFGADEDMFHQALDQAGLSTDVETRKYDYLAAVSHESGPISIQEYRSGKSAKTDYPDGISTSGFVMLAMVFHPEMQGSFDFDCEGQSGWRGQPNWIVHFRQRQDLPNKIQNYQAGHDLFRVDLKGRAWISADKFQIVRIDADMVHPIREVQLLGEHQTVEYGPVMFARKNTSLWLPKSAEIYFDFGKHRYYRRHSFGHYVLFGVDSEQTDKAPPPSDTATKEQSHP